MSVAIGGRRPALEAVRAGQASRLLIAQDARRTAGLRDLRRAAAGAGVPVEIRSRRDLDRLGVEGHQGVVATVVSPPPLGEADLPRLTAAPEALVVILDGVTDPQNLGAAARAAEAAGAAALVVRRRRSAPAGSAAVRASAGALMHLPLVRVVNLTRTIVAIQRRGFTVVGLDHRARLSLYDEPPPERPLALVVGSEGGGLSRLVGETCDRLVAIPMAGRTASLNASSALAVGLFAYALRPAAPEGAAGRRAERIEEGRQAGRGVVPAGPPGLWS